MQVAATHSPGLNFTSNSDKASIERTTHGPLAVTGTGRDEVPSYAAVQARITAIERQERSLKGRLIRHGLAKHALWRDRIRRDNVACGFVLLGLTGTGLMLGALANPTLLYPGIGVWGAALCCARDAAKVVQQCWNYANVMSAEEVQAARHELLQLEEERTRLSPAPQANDRKHEVTASGTSQAHDVVLDVRGTSLPGEVAPGTTDVDPED